MIKTADSNLIFSECLLYHFIFQAFNKKGLLSHVTLLNRVQGRFFPRFSHLKLLVTIIIRPLSKQPNINFQKFSIRNMNRILKLTEEQEQKTKTSIKRTLLCVTLTQSF